MPERLDKLRATLAELESELKSLDSVDEETRSALQETVEEIQAALQKQEGAQLEHESLISRLKTAEQDFEASHPAVSSLVIRLIDGLGQMGI